MALPAWPYDPSPYFTTDLRHWLVGESVCLAVGHVYTKQQRLEAYAHRTCTPSARWQHDSWTNYTLCWMEMLLQIVLADNNNNNNNNGRNSSVCYGRTTEMTSEIVFFCIIQRSEMISWSIHHIILGPEIVSRAAGEKFFSIAVS